MQLLSLCCAQEPLKEDACGGCHEVEIQCLQDQSLHTYNLRGRKSNSFSGGGVKFKFKDQLGNSLACYILPEDLHNSGMRLGMCMYL